MLMSLVKKIKVSIKILNVRLDIILKESFKIKRGLLYATRF